MLETRAFLEQKIARAESLVAQGETRLAAQRARRRSTEQSKRLLGAMEDTQLLLLDHLKVLKRELEQAPQS